MKPVKLIVRSELDGVAFYLKRGAGDTAKRAFWLQPNEVGLLQSQLLLWLQGETPRFDLEVDPVERVEVDLSQKRGNVK